MANKTRGVKEPEMILPELTWKVKTKFKPVTNNEPTDVTINIIKYQGSKKADDGAKCISIIFRDKIYSVFETEYLAIAPLKNRIYFKSVSTRDGYKVTEKGTSGYLKAVVYADEIPVYKAFIGNYALKYDKFYELYYIEREEEE